LRWPDDDSLLISIVCRIAWDEERARQVLSDNQQMFDLVERGLGCPGFQGLGASLKDDVRPHLKWVDMARVMVLRSMSELRAGENEAAFHSCQDLLRFGTLILSRPTTRIDLESGLVSTGMACDQFRHLLDESSLSQATLASLMACLKSSSTDGAMALAIRSEYQRQSEEIDEVASGMTAANSRSVSHRPCRSGYAFHPNRTRTILSDYYRRLLESVDRSYADRKWPNAMSVLDPFARPARMVLRPNSVGRILLALDVGPRWWEATFRRKCVIQCSLSGLRLVVACRSYETKHGDKPDALTALVPEFLEEVPRDPFDGKPFRYARKEAVVYSVGADGVDSTDPNGPPSSKGPIKSDDLVFQIYKRAEPAAPAG